MNVVARPYGAFSWLLLTLRSAADIVPNLQDEEVFDPRVFREKLLQMASATERPRWQLFLEKRASWPLDEQQLRKGQTQPQSQLIPPLKPKRKFSQALASYCWSPDWNPADCCFFSPPDTALQVCFANNTGMFMECCPWESVEEMQSSIMSCDLSLHLNTWKQLQYTFAQCLASGDESCISAVAMRFPLFEDPLCAMGEALRGIFLSANKPYNEMLDSNAILPDGYDECLLYGLDQARCCVRTRFCKCASHPADEVGCNLGVAVECAICLMLVPPVLLRHSGWGPMFGWVLNQLQALSLQRQALKLEPEPLDPLRSITYGSASSAPGHQHRDLLLMSNSSGPLGERLVGTVVEDFFTQLMASATPVDAWTTAVETGIVTGLARYLGHTHLKPRRAVVTKTQLKGISQLIPENLRSLVPGRLVTQGARAKALREMMGPQRVERQRGGMLEAAWLQSLRSWQYRCCPPDVTGALALLHPPPAGLSKWPGLLLALCLACESRDPKLLKSVERDIFCSGQGCGMLMRLQMVEQHAWNTWKDPAAKRWLPFLQLVLQRFNQPKVAKVTGAKEMKVMTTDETLSFIKAGGSMARFGDGEFWSMDRKSITPVVRNRMLQESLVYVARLGASGCPGFKPAMVDVLGPVDSFPDSLNYVWWRERHFFRQIPYRYFPPGNYGNMWVNYRPGDAIREKDRMAMVRFVEGWEEVFLNKSVLLVGHPFAQAATQGHATGVMFAAAKSDYNFPVRVAQLSWEMMREVASQRLPPFSRARDVRLMRPLAIGLASNVRWYSALDTVREVVDNSDIDVVAVSWGPQAKPLVADIACRGTQAVDVGRLLWELHGMSAMSGDLLPKNGAVLDEEDRGDFWGLPSPGRLSSKDDERCCSPKSPWPSLLDKSPNARKKDRSVSQPSAAIARAMQTLSSPNLRRSSSGTLHASRERSSAILELPSVRPTSPGSPESGARRSSYSDYEDACAKLGVLPKFARAIQERRCRDALELSGLGFGDLQLQAMLCDRHLLPLGILSRWRLRDARLTGQGVEVLVSKLPPHTEMLDLCHNDIGFKGISSLANRLQRRLLPQLRWLDLSMNGLRDVAPLTASLLFCPLLVRLELNHNHIEEGQALGDLLAQHPRLARLSLHGNVLGSGGAKLFEGLLENARQGGLLSDLDLAWNQLDGTDVALALAQVLRTSVTLYHLDLSYNNLGPASCQIIADGLRDNHFLYGLHIVGNAATMDADGFLTPVERPKTPSFQRLPTGDELQAQKFGDLRQGIDGRLGARSMDVPGTGSAWTDADVLRERDVLEQQTTCWACEGWERLELQWPVDPGGPIPKAVWAFTSIDGFRAGLRLKPEGEPSKVFAAARMVPREVPVLAIFQVDSGLRTSNQCDRERLPTPVEIELRACEELPVLQPSEVVRTELVQVGGEFEHHLIVRMDTANIISRCQSRNSKSSTSSRTVLLDGPGGPVQMPRITESEFRMRTKVPRGVPFYADYQRESAKLMEECFRLDWSRAKVARIVGKATESDRKSTEEVVLTNYRRFMALFRELSVSGNDAGFGGVTQLEASALLMQAGLVDDVTRVADIDRCFIAAKVLPFDLRKAQHGTLGEKVLSRHQFLEMLLRVADQRFVQTGKCKLMSVAVASVLKSLETAADAKILELDAFHDAFHTDEVDDVIKKHHSVLQEVYRRYSGHVAPPGAARFMSFGEFQDLLEASKSYNHDLVPRKCGLAFRLAMMTQADEVFRTRFQEMSFLEFQHAVGIIAWMRTGCLTTLGLSDMVDSFILERLIPLSRKSGGSLSCTFSGKANIAMTPTAFRGSMLRES